MPEATIPAEPRIAVVSRSGVVALRTLDQIKPQRPGGRGYRASRTSLDPIVAITMMRPGGSIVATTSHGRLVEVNIGPQSIDDNAPRVVCQVGGLVAGEEVVSVDRLSTGSGERTLLVTRLGKGLCIEERLLAQSNAEDAAIQLDPTDKVVQSIRIRTGDVVVFATSRGLVKSIYETSIPSRSFGSKGIMMIKVGSDDYLVAACRSTSPDDFVVLINSNGNLGCFHRSEARPMGRDAGGAVGLRVARPRDALSGAHVAAAQDHILMFATSGRSLRLPVAFTRPKHRGGFGVPVFALESSDTVAASCVVPG